MVSQDVPATTQPKHRLDIQGLRAVAVLTVALDHAGFSFLSGGFVGVDVFFVISGFLITGLLLKEGAKGRISLRTFYSRRARRILPAATLVILATTLASLHLLSFVRARGISSDAIWSALFAANLKFGRDGTDYFAANQPPSPLQHYWSLAVEEQFYLVWPVLLMLLLALLLRRRPDRTVGTPRLRLLALLVLVMAASLAYSVTQTGEAPTAAYFSTLARTWELATGAAVAVAAPFIGRLPGTLKASLSWLGLVAIVVACLAYSPATSFPGYAVALPVVGSALVIAGGVGEGPKGAGVLLNLAPMQRVGDWSYSYYLWHWPALVIAAGYLARDLTHVEALAVLFLALVAAALTYYLVENPFRRSTFVSRRINLGLLMYPASIATITSMAIFAASNVQAQVVRAMHDSPPIDIDQIVETSGYRFSDHRFSKDPAVRAVQATVQAARDGARVPGELTPSVFDLRDASPDFDCDATGGDTTNPICEMGKVGADKTLVLFGNSHARFWIPAIDEVAREEGWSAYYFIKLGCTPALVTPQEEEGSPKGRCLEWRSWAMDQIAEVSPDVTIVASNVPPGVVSPDTGNRVDDDEEVAKLWRKGYEETLSRLAKDAGRVIALEDAPGLEEDPAECLTQRGAAIADCTYPLTGRPLLMSKAAKRAARAAGADFVDTTRWFCADESCPAVIGSFIAYRDDGHVTEAYSESLAEALGRALHLDR